LTGFGLDTLRAGLAALLGDLWVEVDVAVPYTAGELLARVRERGTVEVAYRDRDVRVTGRVAPVLAGELQAVAARWQAASRNGSDGADGPEGVAAPPLAGFDREAEGKSG
jgi:hypothetical protein